MVDEPDTTTYSTRSYKPTSKTYPMIDERGEVPYTWDTSTTPPTKDANDNWIATYDFNAAAADIWEEKAPPWRRILILVRRRWQLFPFADARPILPECPHVPRSWQCEHHHAHTVPGGISE
jgi:hypothetical protein